MDIRIRTTGEVITEREFRERVSAVALATSGMDLMLPTLLSEDLLNEHGADPVVFVEPPPHGPRQFAVQNGAELVDGRWQTAYRLEDMPQTVPASVTMRQARLALLGAGLLNSVTAAINALPGPEKEAAQIEWEYSGEVWRNKALVAMLGPALGLNDAQIDQLFIVAAGL